MPVRDQAVLRAASRWYRRQPAGEVGHLGFPAEQDLPDQPEPRVPRLGLPGVVHAGEPDEVGDGPGAGSVPGQPDGEARVAVEDRSHRWGSGR